MKEKRENWEYYAIGAIALAFILLIMTSCCTAQIGTQFYFANDSCEFYLPDYSQAVEVRDNCCVDSTSFWQEPHSGTRLIPGHDITVTLHGRDCFGNTISMTFDVIVVDSIPPTFYYDSTQFLPMGQYQNEERIFKLYITQDTTDQDDFGNSAITTYYRDPNGHQPIQTNIIAEEYKTSTLDHPDDWRAQIFQSPSNYKLSQVRLKLYKRGYDDSQVVMVDLYEVDASMNPIGQPLSRGKKPTRELFSDTEGAWYTIPMRPTTIYYQARYAIVVHLNRADEEHTVHWKINNDKYPSGYAIWTNNGPNETGPWQLDYTSDRNFEIWGKKI